MPPPALLLLLLLSPLTRAVNPVTTPILKNGLNVYTRPFAQIPPYFGEPARIICMEPRPGSPDLYVCTLTKIYRVTPSGAVSLFLDVAAAVSQNTPRFLSTENKKHGGLRGLAFHTNLRFNGLLYVAAVETRPANPSAFPYISDVDAPVEADSVVLEFKLDPSTDRPDPASYRNLFRIGMPVFDHPIKQLAFFGYYLYIAHGDASEQSATAGGGMRNDGLGKILRIVPFPKNALPYSIPYSNPFVTDPGMKSEVWALGFRNPHTICFDNNGTLFAADAGRSNVEEIDIVLRGKNYGWPAREGTFVHAGGGLISGIRQLPADDAKFGYEYPAAQVGHDGPFRAGFIGQAIAGGCPIENGSPMAGSYYYSDFPESGKLFYSKLTELKNAKTRGPPGELTQARTRQATIFFDHDKNPSTPPKKFETLGDVMRSEPGMSTQSRVDVRFGRGSKGELYWSSKKTGRVYLFTSSLPGGPGGPV